MGFRRIKLERGNGTVSGKYSGAGAKWNLPGLFHHTQANILHSAWLLTEFLGTNVFLFSEAERR